MDKKTVFVKTDIGEGEVSGSSDALFGDAKRILHLVDDESTVAEITKRAPPSLRESLQIVLQELVDGGYIRDMREPENAPQKSTIKFARPSFKMATPKAVTPSAPAFKPVQTNQSLVNKSADTAQAAQESDLDFSFITSGKNDADDRAEKQEIQAEEAAKARRAAEQLKSEQAAALEAAVNAAKQKSYNEAKAKAQNDVAARATIEAAVRLKKEAEDARKMAEQAALNARAESEAAKARVEAEVRARLEAEARVKKEAELRAKQAAEAIRLKAEKEAERLRLELQAAKIKAENELRIRLEAEARAKAEAEARLKQEAEAERLRLEKKRAEIEVARIKAEAELKMREEAEIRIKAEIDARTKTEALLKEAEERKSKANAKPGEKVRQSLVDSLDLNKAGQGGNTGSFILEDFSLVNTDKVVALAGEVLRPGPLSSGEAGNSPSAEDKAKKEAEEIQAKARARQAEDAKRQKAEEESARKLAEYDAYRLKKMQEEEQAEAQKLADVQSKQWEEAQNRAEVLAKAEKERLAIQAAEAAASKSRQKTARVQRKPLPLGKIVTGFVVLLLVAVLGLPYIWPLADYIAPLEAEISAQIKQPVHIKSINVAVLPMPKLTLNSVTLGKTGELKINSVEINFDLSALLASTKSINKLVLNDLSLAGSSFERAFSWLQASGGIEKYPVARMAFNGLRIQGSELKLPVLNGNADFDPQGKLIVANLKSDKSDLALDMHLQQNNLLLEINLHEGALPIFPDLKFKELSANALIANNGAVISDFFAHIYGGTLTGKGILNWSNGWKLQGQINARNLELQSLFPKYGLDGELAGEIELSMSSPTLAQLDKDARIEGSFEAKNGVIDKLDIETVARFGARQGVAGHTNFSEITGGIKADNHGLQIAVKNLASASANSSGIIGVDASQNVSGKLRVDVKPYGDRGITLYLSGKATDPVLQSGR